LVTADVGIGRAITDGRHDCSETVDAELGTKEFRVNIFGK